MILAAYLVTALPGRLRLRGRDAARAPRPPPPARAADPADRRLRSWPRSSSSSATPRRARSPRTSRSSSRRWSASQHTHRDVTEYIGGICTDDGVKWGIGIPGLDSFLVGFSTDTEVIGLDSVPPDERPPANTLLHLAFDAMVGIGTGADRLGLWFGIVWWRKRDIPQTPWFLRVGRGLGRARDRRHGGRLDRDRGRAPALDRLRDDAHRGGGHRRERHLGHVLDRARPLHACSGSRPCSCLRSMARRWREAGRRRRRGPVRAARRSRPGRGGSG